MKNILVSLLFMMLVGCKILTEVEVSTDQLTAENPESIVASLFIEIPTCTDYQDSRNESDSLREARTKTPELFKGAEFQECFTQRLDTWAHFRIPIGITKNADSNTEDLSLYSNEHVLVGISAKKDFRDRLQRQNESSTITSDYRITVGLTFNQDYTATAYSSYVDGTPITVGTAEFKTGGNIDFSLSDVSVDQLMSRGYVAVLVYE